MDKERKKRIQTIRLVITEIIMVIAVIVIVVVFTFLAMGYGVDKNGELNQAGLVQVKSIPTGATVTIDDDTLLMHTNTSRMLDAGAHHLRLEKDGYDTWEKEIISESGVLLKLEYPRLFLKDRTAEKIKTLENTDFFSVSQDKAQILSVANGKWSLLNLRGDEVSETELNLAEITKDLSVKNAIWSKNSDRALLKTAKNSETRWLLFDLKTPENSLDLTKIFGLNFSEMVFADSGNRILAVENGNLRMISASDRTISEVLIKNVEKFTHNDSTIAYLTYGGEFKLYREGDEDVLIRNFSPENSVFIGVSEYLGKKYLSFVDGNRFYVFRGTYPTEDKNLSEMELILENDVAFVPTNFYIWSENELIIAENGNHLAVFDAELSKLSEFTVEGDSAFFLDNYLIGTITGEKFIIRDFDGANRRELLDFSNTDTVKIDLGTAFIAKNNKYLYYFQNSTLFREKIIN